MNGALFIREDFAGPGGWDTGLRMLEVGDYELVGVEYAGKVDPAAAARVAVKAGYKRWVADVTCEAVRDYRWPRMWGYIASPPCQTFSMAGGGSGRQHMEHLIHAMKLVADGWTPEDAIAEVADEKLDVRSVLVLEPLLVIREHEPRWIAFEQVKEVQPIWDAYAEILRGWGYSVWTGCLNAEQYGVPQTRRRAILIASLDREVHEPTPTHSRYYSRSPEKLDEGVLKWVSMAEALTLADEVYMRSNYGTDGDPAARGERDADEPAFAVTSRIDRNKWRMRGNQKPEGGTSGVNEDGYQIREPRAPSPTITSGARSNRWEPTHLAGAGQTAQQTSGQRPRSVDEPAHTIAGKGTAAWLKGGPQERATVRSVDEPAPTIFSQRSGNITWLEHPDGGSRFNDQTGTPYDEQWPEKRPSTTVAGREIVQNPGATANRFNGSTKSRNDGVRVTVEEAGVLQSFPADYPWAAAGTKTSQFQRVGDAIPPLLARAVLAEALGIPFGPAPVGLPV